MVDVILEAINLGLLGLLSKLERPPQDVLYQKTLEDSILQLVRHVDSLSEQIDQHTETLTGLLVPSADSTRSTKGNVPRDFSFLSEKVLQQLKECINVAEKLNKCMTYGAKRGNECSGGGKDRESYGFCSRAATPGVENTAADCRATPVKVAMDIGGTLIKVAYISDRNGHKDADILYLFYQSMYNLVRSMENRLSVDVLTKCELGTRLMKEVPNSIALNDSCMLNLKVFPVEKLDDVFNFLEENNLAAKGTVINATGGGIYKYEAVFKERFPQCEVRKLPEMQCLVAGIMGIHYFENAFLKYILDPLHTEIVTEEISYPYLIVNIGSGVFMTKVSSKDAFEWVTGTSLGGGTTYGLSSVLLGVNNFSDIAKLYQNGHNCMDTFDISSPAGGPPPYGMDTSFGALDMNTYFHTNAGVPPLQFSRENQARSIADMISYNLGIIAFLVAKMHGIKRILFAGSYSLSYRMAMDSAASAVKYMAKLHNEESMELLVPFFASHIGAFGCLLSH